MAIVQDVGVTVLFAVGLAKFSGVTREDRQMAGYRVISSDNHIIEPPDLWTDRIAPRFKERAPRMVPEKDGRDFWYCDGRRIKGVTFQPGVRFEAPQKLVPSGAFESVTPGAYIPDEHVKDMDIDGIDVSIVYPTLGLILFRVPDGELLTDVFRAYNDWMAEFCGPFPRRLKGIGMVNVDDVQVAVLELERCANMGLASAMISVYPSESQPYNSPLYEPLWAAAQDLRMPLSFHIGTNRLGVDELCPPVDPSTPSYQCNRDHWVRASLAHLIYTGVFERYPELRVGAVEHELGWIPYFMERLDYYYTQTAIGINSYRYEEDMLPSDYFRRNVFVGFQEDLSGIRDRHIIGVDLLHWGSDYPHVESTFPRSREILEEILMDCTEEEKAKIAGGNAARVYNLD